MQKFLWNIVWIQISSKTVIFCGVNTGLFNWNETRLSTGYSTMVDGITPHISFKMKGDVVVEVILLHLQPGQTLLCSGIILALESKGPGFKSQN